MKLGIPWTLSHRKTGYSITRAWTEEGAKRAAEALAKLDVDWKTLTVEGAKNLPKETLQKIQRIKKRNWQ